ncbi:hypothetical protein BC829DRAFT_417822 [Chytridium lagenaria]|nr:hypothetical protein BC829DRAFT_417822 [Chytridium lagenaria]
MTPAWDGRDQTPAGGRRTRSPARRPEAAARSKSAPQLKENQSSKWRCCVSLTRKRVSVLQEKISCDLGGVGKDWGRLHWHNEGLGGFPGDDIQKIVDHRASGAALTGHTEGSYGTWACGQDAGEGQEDGLKSTWKGNRLNRFGSGIVPGYNVGVTAKAKHHGVLDVWNKGREPRVPTHGKNNNSDKTKGTKMIKNRRYHRERGIKPCHRYQTGPKDGSDGKRTRRRYGSRRKNPPRDSVSFDIELAGYVVETEDHVVKTGEAPNALQYGVQERRARGTLGECQEEAHVVDARIHPAWRGF